SHRLANVIIPGAARFSKESCCGHDLPRRAITALEGIVFDKSRLHGRELLAVGKALNGRHVMAIMHQSEGQAGVHTAAVNVDGTGATLAVITALLGAEQL